MTMIKHPGHDMYIGVTMTGKTTLARMHSRALAKAQPDRLQVVYDPVRSTTTLGGGWPEGAVIYEDFEGFMQWASKNGDADLWIDEAADHFGVGDRENHWLLRRGRHYGYVVHLISQRPKMLAPNVRGQCTRAYVFRLAKSDLVEVAADLGTEVVDPPVDTGHYIVIDTQVAEIYQHRLFD
jgi:hypothetical protein